MNIRLWNNFRKIKKDLQPTREFKNELWASLDKKWDEVHGPVIWYRLVWVKVTTYMVSGIFGVSTVATGVYAYNSPDVTEGTPLYGVKQTIETIVEKTKTTPEAKAKFLLAKAERREKEKKVIERRIVSALPQPIVSTSTNVVPTSTEREEVEVKMESDDDVIKTEKALEKVEQELVVVRDQVKDKELKKEIEKLIEKREKRSERKEDIKKRNDDFATTTKKEVKNEEKFERKEKKEERKDKKEEKRRGTYIDLQNGRVSRYEIAAPSTTVPTTSLHWDLDDDDDTKNIIKYLPVSSTLSLIPTSTAAVIVQTSTTQSVISTTTSAASTPEMHEREEKGGSTGSSEKVEDHEDVKEEDHD